MVTVRTTIVSDSSTDERPSIDRPAVIVADLPEDVGTAGGDADPDTEQVKAADFLCNCKLSNGTPSSTRHSVKELLASRSQEAIHVMPQVVLSRTLRYTPIVVLSKISLLHCCISTTM
ncbi:uncharacterized protein [Asterias amurensis]|uniref:uncharacterized protein n=1 Tax=Asterias amurensis TaxID=7602 RepID=UPI003AB4346E